MVQKIAKYCRSHYRFVSQIKDKATMRRLAKIVALEYAIETTADMNVCLSETVINAVINKLMPKQIESYEY